MSHYLVAVMTKTEPNENDIANVLAAYDENLSVPRYVRYTKAQVIANERECLESFKNGRYAQYLADPDKYAAENDVQRVQYVSEEFPKLLQMSDEELYQRKTGDYAKLSEIEPDSDKTAIDDDGNVTSTYNPNSKWDWWVIGGRWCGELPCKAGEGYDTAMVRDINFGNDVTAEQYIKQHPDIVETYNKLVTEGDGWYRVEYLQKRYPTLEDYVNEVKNWTPYSFVDLDGKWHEPGQVGWFGCSSASEEDEIAWTRDFYKRFIEGHDDCYITIVDCHI